jgi:hypothetical protein
MWAVTGSLVDGRSLLASRTTEPNTPFPIGETVPEHA